MTKMKEILAYGLPIVTGINLIFGILFNLKYWTLKKYILVKFI